ncbi:MAG: ATP-binding protein [Acidobacteriota bacterium]
MSELRATFGSVERAGPWPVPRELDVRVRFGHALLDLREAVLEPGETVFHVSVRMGNLEVIVPPELAVDMNVESFASNLEEVRRRAASPDPDKPRLKITGSVKAGNCEVVALRPDETREDAARRLKRERRHRRWHEVHREREMWRHHPDRSAWLPWWLQARMRRRMFIWMVLVFGVGVGVGVHAWDHGRWWHLAIAFVLLSMLSGAIAWRMTRPLLAAIRAARDIGEGKLDTRVPVHHRGEMRVLASAINDMAEKIQRQLEDQRQLLAAVSHELRTPLGHMRVLIETARERGDTKELAELEREVLVLDDLVGKLLASSRLEFGNLDRRDVDLGELVADVATSAGVAPDAIEATGDVHASIDPTLVRRAVANLLDNARLHGGGAVAVRVVRRGAQVAIEVDDAGPGVAPDRRADAFRAFVPSRAGGLGLGLALVSRIAVAHGGGAWIADRPGGGARVGFTVAG